MTGPDYGPPPGLERARVAQVTPARGVYVTLDRFHRSQASGPLITDDATPTLHVGDHIVVGCLGGSLDDVMFVALLT